MKRIQSFEIDHTQLEKGVYVSRVDAVGRSFVTTFDLRMKAPYRDARLHGTSAHALEHALATYLRNTRNDVLYVGPMGCLTGFYVLLTGKKEVKQLLPSLIDAFEWILTLTQVPGATRYECGNFPFMDLAKAKMDAEQYLQVLKTL